LGELVGISSQPIDVIDRASDCQSVISEDNVCEPIRGGVSLYVKDGSKGIDYVAHSSIKKIMDKDLLLSAHDSIVKVIHMSKVKFRDEDDDIGDNDLDEDTDTKIWGSLYVRGVMLSILSICVTIFAIKCVVNRSNRKNRSGLSHSSPSDWTEIVPEAGYINSSDSTTTSDDETILTSNKVGSIVNTIKTEEMVVDVDIESHSIGLQKNTHIDQTDEFFNVIFDETKEKKITKVDDASEISSRI